MPASRGRHVGVTCDWWNARRILEEPADLLHWLRGWHDREGAWANLRNIEHWIDRADP